jgi:hypothetical protein
MKPVADWIRTWTPDWTDEDRYNWVSAFHAWMLPVCLAGGFLVQNWVVRMAILVIQVITILTEFYFRECLITRVEKEFSQKSWDDVVTRTFKALGWQMTRNEKMTFNIGINVGILIAFLIVLLRESLLWLVGVASISVTALPFLAWFSKVRPLPEIALPVLR